MFYHRNAEIWSDEMTNDAQSDEKSPGGRNPKRGNQFILCEYGVILIEFALLVSLFVAVPSLPTRAEVFFRLHLNGYFNVLCLILGLTAVLFALIDLRRSGELSLTRTSVAILLAYAGVFYSGEWKLQTIPYTATKICVGGEFRSIGKALEDYFTDFGKYPAELVPCLTTPTPYIGRIPSPDPFCRDSPYLYCAMDSTWVLTSTGPDEIHDLSLDDLVPPALEMDFLTV